MNCIRIPFQLMTNKVEVSWTVFVFTERTWWLHNFWLPHSSREVMRTSRSGVACAIQYSSASSVIQKRRGRKAARSGARFIKMSCAQPAANRDVVKASAKMLTDNSLGDGGGRGSQSNWKSPANNLTASLWLQLSFALKPDSFYCVWWSCEAVTPWTVTVTVTV